MARILRLRRGRGTSQHYWGIPVVNLLQAEGRLGFLQQMERRQLLAGVALALVLAAGALAAWNLYSDSMASEQSLQGVNARLEHVRSNLKRIVVLENSITALEQEKQGLQRDWEKLTPQSPGQLPALQAILRSKSPDVTLRSLNATRDGRIAIQGETSYSAALLAWQDRLATSVPSLRMLSLNLVESKGSSLYTFTMNMKLTEGGTP